MPARSESYPKKTRFTPLPIMQDEEVLLTEVKQATPTEIDSTLNMPVVPVPVLKRWIKTAEMEEKVKEDLLDLIRRHSVGDARARVHRGGNARNNSGSTLSDKLSIVYRLIPHRYSSDFRPDDQVLQVFVSGSQLGPKWNKCDCGYYNTLKSAIKKGTVAAIETFNPDIKVGSVGANMSCSKFVGIRLLGIIVYALLAVCCALRIVGIFIVYCCCCCFRRPLGEDSDQEEMDAVIDSARILFFSLINIIRCTNLGVFAGFGFVFSGFGIGIMRTCSLLHICMKDLKDPVQRAVAFKNFFILFNVFAALVWGALSVYFIVNKQQEYLQHLILLQIFFMVVIYATRLRIDPPNEQSECWRLEARLLVCCVVGIFAATWLVLLMKEGHSEDACDCDKPSNREAYALWAYSLLGGFSSFLL